MTANDSKSYLSCLNKLVDQYNNTYHHSIGKKRIHADYSVLTKKDKNKNSEAPKLKKKMIESELLSIWVFLVNVIMKIGQEKYLLSVLF